MGGGCSQGAAQGRPPQEARAAAAAGHDADQDGSRHEWPEGQAPLDLIVTLDDATGSIYSAFLVEAEGTASTFRALNEVFSQHGLPISLYTDRGSHYFRTTKAGEIDLGCRPRSGGPLSNSGSSISGLSHRRPGVARSGRFRRCRTGGRRNSSAAPSPTSRPATPSSRTSTRRSTTPASPSIRKAKAQPSRRFQASIPTRSCACRRSVRSKRHLRLQPDAETADPESPMRPTSSGAVKVHVYPDGFHALFHGPDASDATTRKKRSRTATMKNAPLKSARRRAPRGRHGQASGLPTPPTR